MKKNWITCRVRRRCNTWIGKFYRQNSIRMFMIQFERLYEFRVVSDIAQLFELLVDSIGALRIFRTNVKERSFTYDHDEENSLIEMKNMG